MADVLERFDPRFAPEHAAYYIEGVRRHSGIRRLPLTREGFPAAYTDRQPLAFVLRRGSESRKFYIGAGDEYWFDEAALEWADVYGKVNVLRDAVPAEHAHKVVPIGPSWALKSWSGFEAIRLAAETHLRGGRITERFRDHYRRHWVLYRRRLDETHYQPAPSEDRYVFYNAWLWKKHPEVNPPRAEFIRACKELDGVDFEGGFLPRRQQDMPEYDDVITTRYPLSAYLRNIKRSAVVFNNPAVHDCHGWKLCEFLGLGKAIISLPLSREMPAPLRHGEHIHYVDGSRDSIKAAVRMLVDDRAYRDRLERAARQYFLTYLAPATVISRLAELAFTGRLAESENADLRDHTAD